MSTRRCSIGDLFPLKGISSIFFETDFGSSDAQYIHLFSNDNLGFTGLDSLGDPLADEQFRAGMKTYGYYLL